MLSFIGAWINGWVNSHEAGDLRRHRAHYDVTVMHATVSDRSRTECLLSASQNHSTWRWNPMATHSIPLALWCTEGFRPFHNMWVHNWNLVKLLFALDMILTIMLFQNFAAWSDHNFSRINAFVLQDLDYELINPLWNGSAECQVAGIVVVNSSKRQRLGCDTFPDAMVLLPDT